MNLLKEVEDSLRYWTECAVRDMRAGDPHNHRDKSLERAANLATIALALRAAEKGAHV